MAKGSKTKANLKTSQVNEDKHYRFAGQDYTAKQLRALTVQAGGNFQVPPGGISAKPRRIELMLPEGLTITELTRPLRCETAQGPRVALACSESIPEGTTLEFELVMLDPCLEGVVHEWFDYGQLRGLGQWRNSGAGRFLWERLDTHDAGTLKKMPAKKAKTQTPVAA